jgi:serine/threonine protein kinase
MGEVWRSRGPDGVEVALKIPRRPVFLRHLRREGFLLAQVDHPHVARFVASDTLSEPPYLATELVRGDSLRSLCRGTIAASAATLLCDQILDGLEAIHRAGILHLDLKPENVLVQKDGSAKIVDLGLGKATTAFMAELFLSASLASRDVPLAGTLAYMSPEQRKGKPVDARADLFAFGVLLHELLSGKLPDPATRLSKLRKDLPPRWDVVVSKLTHPDAAARPASAAMARQLIAFTLHEKQMRPVASGGHAPRDLASFDEEAFLYESPWSPGMVVGECELEALLGRGGFGEVWRAKRTREEGKTGGGGDGDEVDGPPRSRVALKLAIREEARAALGKEAELARRVEHPSVPKVLDDRSADDPPHVVFELVEGTSLRALINEDGLIPLDEALAIMERMVDVVQACHARGVIHRDLKPEHFLVKGESLKLIDFGLAAIVGGHGAEASLGTGDARGTYDYMAPEQRAGGNVGTPADVFSLGTCFFEMIADELPRGPQSLKQLRREVPDSVDRAVTAMLASDPWQRPSLGAVRQALGGIETASGRAAAAAPRSELPRKQIPYYVWFIFSALFLAGSSAEVPTRLVVVVALGALAVFVSSVMNER